MYVVYTDGVHSYLLYFPDSSGCKAHKLQKRFDKWLYDKTIDHDCWVYVDGKKYGVSYDVYDFIKWLNQNIFTDSDDKVRIEGEKFPNTPVELEILYY